MPCSVADEGGEAAPRFLQAQSQTVQLNPPQPPGSGGDSTLHLRVVERLIAGFFQFHHPVCCLLRLISGSTPQNKTSRAVIKTAFCLETTAEHTHTPNMQPRHTDEEPRTTSSSSSVSLNKSFFFCSTHSDPAQGPSCV